MSEKLEVKEIGRIDDNTTVAIIPLELLEFNPYNANVTNQNDFDKIKENIEKVGFVEFPVVIKSGNMYKVVHGEHRIQAFGGDAVPCTISEKMTEKDWMAGSITFNKFRGNLNQEKTAKLLEEMAKHMTIEEVKERTLLRKFQVDEYLSLGKAKEAISHDQLEEAIEQHKENYDRNVETVKRIVDTELKEMKTTPITEMPRSKFFSLKPDDFDFVSQVLDGINTNQEKALVEVCTFYHDNKE